MLEQNCGPVLEDYPHNSEDVETGQGPASCPINFSTRTEGLSDKDKFSKRLHEEIGTMQTWHDIARDKRSRSTADISGLSPGQIIEFFLGFVSGIEQPSVVKKQKISNLLRIAAEDLKAFYQEAVSAQPGQSTNPDILADWFWGETQAAMLINEVRKSCLKRESKDMKLAGKLLLIPRNQMYRFKADTD